MNWLVFQNVLNNTRPFSLEVNKKQDIEELLKSFYRLVLNKRMRSTSKLTEDELYGFIRFLKYYKRVLLLDEQTNLSANTKNYSRSTIHTIVLKENMGQAAFLVYEGKVVGQYYGYKKDAIELQFEDGNIAVPMLDISNKLNYVNPINGNSYFGIIESVSLIGQEENKLSFYFVKRNGKELLISRETRTIVGSELDRIHGLQLIQNELFLCGELNHELVYIHVNSGIMFKNEVVEFKGKTFDFRRRRKGIY